MKDTGTLLDPTQLPPNLMRGIAGGRAGPGRLHVRPKRPQTLNELPQPQDEVAFGFFTWNDEPTISST